MKRKVHPKVTRALLPCLCLSLSSATVARLDQTFGSCPLCRGTGAYTREHGEKFAKAWQQLNPGEAEQ